MLLSLVCPAGVANASKEVVWEVLTQPRLYERWMDARPVKPWGRRLRAGDNLGLRVKGLPLRVTWDVNECDYERGRLQLAIRLPLGVRNDERITISSQGEEKTVIRFY
jgi:hypothetical protein